MTPHEASEVLAMAARADKRTVGVEDIKLWCAALTAAGVTRDEALMAVVEHTTTRPDVYLGHGHVIEIVRRHRRGSLDHSWINEARELAEVDPDDPRATNRALRRARRAALARGLNPDEVLALPAGKFDPTEEQRERNARGAQLAREVLAEHQAEEPQAIGSEPVPRSEALLEAARARAARERRATPDVGPVPLGSLVGDLARRARERAAERSGDVEEG